LNERAANLCRRLVTAGRWALPLALSACMLSQGASLGDDAIDTDGGDLLDVHIGDDADTPDSAVDDAQVVTPPSHHDDDDDDHPLSTLLDAGSDDFAAPDAGASSTEFTFDAAVQSATQTPDAEVELLDASAVQGLDDAATASDASTTSSDAAPPHDDDHDGGSDDTAALCVTEPWHCV